ncbi:twin-arginine translocation signal domain-containing protein [Ideonella sp. YS5]|uniref:twin-arginine translocation signal domain-containing protein n=1 Tax=Ideonella sp. YS5 TaxID=3453714 RepID=UPI003EE9469D
MKSNRRDFLKTTAATGAAVAAIDARASLAGPGAADMASPLGGRAGLRLSLYGLPADVRVAARAQLDGVARAAGASPRRLQVQLLQHAPMPWMAEDIALLTKFAPALDGVALETLGLPEAAAAAASFERHWAGRRTAVVVGLEPQAMLIHRRKAREAGITGTTLADFAERGVRPRLPLSLDFGSGVNGWIHPVFAEFTGWHQGPSPSAASLFLDEPALSGMRRLRRLLLDEVDAPVAESSDGGLSALVDDRRDELVASYGNPLLLAHRLARAGRSLEDEFEVVPLQRFMGLKVPSLFRSAAIQLGSRVRREEAAEVVAGMTRPAAIEALLGCLPHVAALRSEWLSALPNDHAFYAGLPHLNVMADARLMTTLALNLRRPADGTGADEVMVAHAASQAYYELAGYASSPAHAA